MIYGDVQSDYPSISAIMQSANLYAYTMNNPIKYIDPTGNSFWDSIKGFFNGIAKYFSKGKLSLDFEYEDEIDYQVGSWMGEKFTDFTQSNDFVFDVSISAGIVTVGYSYIDANKSGYEAGYVHVGGGYSVGLMPVGASVSLGIVENAENPEDYEKHFIDISGSLGIGADYCEWPGGSSATSITLATNPGAGVRLDYYVLVHSTVDDKDYYNLYKKVGD